jgi:hypothetical protein
MYRKNTASQYIYFCLVNATTGAALTGAAVTAYRALDNGSQAAATGTTTELANGQYRFNLSQADTNAENGSYLFVATSAVPVEKTVVFTSANPSDATAFGLSRLDAEISSRMASYTQPTGFLAATFPATVSSYAGGAVASVTAGVTVTTNNDKTGYTVSTVSDKTGYSLTAGTGLGNQTANITGNLSGSVGSVTTVSTGAITTASFAAGAIDAAAIATDAIGSAEISAAAVTKIQTGLATPTNITAATGVTLAAVTHTGAVIPTVSTVTNGVTLATTQPAITFGAVTIDVSGSTPNITLTGSGSGNGIEWTRSGSGNPLDADVVDQIQSGLSTEVAAIKTKTDQLTFTVANKVDSAAELDSAVGTQITNIENASGYLLAVLAGACADPQTASETYAITVFGSTFTVDMAGQTSTGTRTAPTLTKT